MNDVTAVRNVRTLDNDKNGPKHSPRPNNHKTATLLWTDTALAKVTTPDIKENNNSWGYQLTEIRSPLEVFSFSFSSVYLLICSQLSQQWLGCLQNQLETAIRHRGYH